MGIGDNVCMIPAIAELAKTKKVTLYTERPEMFAALPIETVRLNKHKGTCEDGRVLDPTWDEIELDNCETLYKIDGDLIWRWPASFRDVSPQMRMALALGVSIPDGFDYAAALGATKKPWSGVRIFAPKSTDVKRSMPDAVANAMQHALPKSYLRISGGGWFAPSIQELIDVIYSAEHVLSVDTGIAHIAAALKIPLTVVGAYSDAVGYYSHYEGSIKVIQKACRKGSCECKKYAECMNVNPEEILTNLEV
jgi:hypothetical protein